MANQQAQALEYLKEHNIPEMFENMTAQLVFQRPENPRQFLTEYIEKLQAQQAKVDDGQAPDISALPVLFSDDNAAAVFRLFDVTGRGWITLEQYKKGMRNMFITDYNETPAGFVDNRITLDTFVAECRQGVAASTLQ
eukprot:m.258107 g.258107  ORF g.258107 m.258107 type:complete len:138 (-) comp15536_c3_seq1:6381-6794(-)